LVRWSESFLFTYIAHAIDLQAHSQTSPSVYSAHWHCFRICSSYRIYILQHLATSVGTCLHGKSYGDSLDMVYYRFVLPHVFSMVCCKHNSNST
jgi:hypothetical protein